MMRGASSSLRALWTGAIPAAGLLLLLCSAWPASGMTSEEFDTYWVGGPILPSGRSTNVIHPRLLVLQSDLTAAIGFYDDVGTLNKAIATRESAFFNTNVSNGRPAPYGNTSQNECFAVLGHMILDAAKHADNATNRGYAASCSTCFGIMVDGQPDDPLIAESQYLPPYECGWTVDGGVIEGEGPGSYPSTVFAYDLMMAGNPIDDGAWISQRRKHRAIRALAPAMNASRYEDSGGGRMQWTEYGAVVLLGIYGDSADASFNAAIKSELLLRINEYEAAAACWQSTDSVGFQPQYHVARDNARMIFARAMQLCFPGYSSPVLAAKAITDGGKFYRWVARPVPTDLATHSAKILGLERGPDKFNTKGWAPVTILSLRAAMFDDEHSWLLADNMGEQDLSIGPNNTSGIAGRWYPALWHDPGAFPSASFSTFEKHFWNSRFGVFSMRSAWNAPGASNTDVRVWHYPLYLDAAGHKSAGTLIQVRGDDNLIIPGWTYFTDLTSDFQQSYAQSWSENVGGVMVSGYRSYGNSGSTTFTLYDNGAQTGCVSSLTQQHLDFGGQVDNGIDSGITPCENYDTGVLRTHIDKRADLIQDCMDETNGIYFVSSDLTDSYPAAHIEYKRRSVFVDGSGNLFVWDQTKNKVSAAYNYEHLRLINAPMNQTGTITVLRGGGISSADSIRVDSDGTAGDTHGGIYQIAGNTIRESASAAVKVVVGSSAAWIFPLEVRNATDAANGYLLAIGGPNKTGQHWRHSRYPCAENYQTGNGTAFDCWLWGASGPLAGYNEPPGCYAKGSCTTLCSNGGDGNPRYRLNDSNVVSSANAYIPNRNTFCADTQAGSVGAGKAATDWSLFTIVAGAGANDVVESMFCSIPTASGASKPTVKYARTGELLAVAVDANLNVFPSGTSASRLTSATWSNPLTTENVTVKVAGLAHATAFNLLHNGVDTGTDVTSTANGTATWSHSTDGVTSFTLSVGTATTGACCAAAGTCTVVSPASCSGASGTYQGDGTDCDPNPCPQPTGACCTVDSGICSVTTEVACETLGSTYEGNGTDCDPNPCVESTGGCCVSGVCFVLTATNCGSSSGSFNGYGSTCTPDPCGSTPETGACCVSGSCSSYTSTLCGLLGGSYLGDGTTCGPSTCAAEPTGACCFGDGTCVVDTEAGCGELGGDWRGEATVCDPNPCPPAASGGSGSGGGRRPSTSGEGVGDTSNIGGGPR